jgi:hypothetical protein
MMSVSSTVHKAFNIVVTKTMFPAGVITCTDPLVNNVFQIGSTPSFVWLYTKGRCFGVNTETGQKLNWVPGDCSLVSPYPKGEWRAEFEEDTEVLCVSPFMNPSNLPLSNWLTPFVLKAGETTTLELGTKLFIGVGKLRVDEKLFLSPAQIRFSSGGKAVSAEEDTYGFIVA